MQAQRGPDNSHVFSDRCLDDLFLRSTEDNGYATIQISPSTSPSSSSSTVAAASVSPRTRFSPFGDNYIEHRVSKMDTLAGVAIKYGVEVADIKRMNGLVTDIQMFAHKSLQIPLPGRHPPSPVVSNGSVHNGENTLPHGSCDAILHSFPSLNLRPSSQKVHSTEATEMFAYKSRKTLFKDEISLKTTTTDPLHSLYQKSQSWWNFLSPGKDDIAVDITESDKSIRIHRQGTDADISQHASEILLKGSNGGLFSTRGKGLALRPKPGSRGDGESCLQNSALGGDSVLADVRISVRKSSSTISLSEIDSSSVVWPTSKWYLNADVVARPVIDGPPKPASARRNHKAALD